MDKVERWMTQPALVAPATMTVPEARRFMQQQCIRRLPVVNDAEELVGILTEGDIAHVSGSPETDVQQYDLHHTVRDLPIHEIMSRNVVTVTADARMEQVAQLLLEHRIGGVPVVEGKRVVGVVSATDLFRLIANSENGSAR